MLRTLLAVSTASLALLAACQKPDAPADPAQPAEATAQVSEAGAPPFDGRAEAGRRGDGPRPPRGPQTLADMERRIDEQFSRLDADSDGVVTTAELDAAGGRGGRMLARSDTDGDGRITRAEASAGAAEMFRRMDADGDGVISEDERPSRGGRPGGPRGPAT